MRMLHVHTISQKWSQPNFHQVKLHFVKDIKPYTLHCVHILREAEKEGEFNWFLFCLAKRDDYIFPICIILIQYTTPYTYVWTVRMTISFHTQSFCKVYGGNQAKHLYAHLLIRCYLSWPEYQSNEKRTLFELRDIYYSVM